MTRISLDQWGLNLADVSATRSPCVRRQVGAVLIKGNRVVSMGYNGPAAGLCHKTIHTCVRTGLPSGSEPHKVCCAHAEANAVSFCDRDDAKGATLYCTDSPCSQCCDHIINAGVSRVVCKKPYADMSGIEKLHEAGVLITIMEVRE